MKFKIYLFCIIFLILGFLGLLYQKRALVFAQTTPTPTTEQNPTSTPTPTKKPTDTPTPTKQEEDSPSPTPTKKPATPTPAKKKKRKRLTSTPYPSLSPTSEPTEFPSPTIEPTATPSGLLRSVSGNFLAFLITFIGVVLLGIGLYLSKRSKGGFRRKSRLRI